MSGEETNWFQASMWELNRSGQEIPSRSPEEFEDNTEKETQVVEPRMDYDE